MQESNVFALAEHGLLLPRDTAAMNGTAVPVHLIGDTAYPLTSWLLKPYTQATAVGRDKRHFNYWHSRARMVVGEHLAG